MIPYINRIGFIIALLLLANCIKAQSYQAEYSYDAKGNRILTNVVYLSQLIKQEPLQDQFDVNPDIELSVTVKIYPNPTKGNLLVEIESSSFEEVAYPPSGIVLFDMKGKKLWETKSITELNTVDLSAYPNGVYILQLQLAGKHKAYKVIKN